VEKPTLVDRKTSQKRDVFYTLTDVFLYTNG